MLSKARLKYIKSLQLKKYRKEEQCFVVEGAKNVQELLYSDFEVIQVVATGEFERQHRKQLVARKIETVESTDHELSALGSLQTNNAALAVVRMKPNRRPELKPDEFALALDDIRDPGNVGTIIRTADWYGITSIVASEETADLYNAKTISATMGSFCRVNVFYTSLIEFLPTVSRVYGTFLDGEDVHTVTFPNGGVIVIGNESNGISLGVGRLVHHRIAIPNYGNAESLNAGVATGVILDNLHRRRN